MSDPIAFTGATPRLDLPLLFAGQAQKEFYVNEALLRAEIAIQCVVLGETDQPPAAPEPGQAWIVGSQPSGAFAGHPGAIAGFSSSGWRYIEPSDGFRVFDAAAGSFRLFSSGWQEFVAPDAPTAGTTVDAEARAALAELIARLAAAGIFSAA